MSAPSDVRRPLEERDSAISDRARDLIDVVSPKTRLSTGGFTAEVEEDEEREQVPPGCIRVTVVHNNKERIEVVDAAELAHLQAQQRAALLQLRRSEDLFTIPEWVRLHPLLGSYLAEAIGTFAWVLTVSLCKSSVQENALVLQSTTRMDMLPTGMMLTAMIFGLGYISGGHFNPAVSLAVFLAHKMEFSKLLSYMVIQLAAGLGAGLVAMLILNDNDIFVPNVSSEYISSGVFSELIFTLAIAIVALNTRYSQQQSNFYYAFAVGMTVAAGSACAGRISGGSFNPAAATGLQAAMCFAGNCDALKVFWVYWVAPLIGSGIAAILFSQMDQPMDSPILLRDEKVIPVQVPASVNPATATQTIAQRHQEIFARRQKRRARREAHEGSPRRTPESTSPSMVFSGDAEDSKQEWQRQQRSHYVSFSDAVPREEPAERRERSPSQAKRGASPDVDV